MAVEISQEIGIQRANMSKTNPVSYPLHLAIGDLSGRALLHSSQNVQH